MKQNCSVCHFAVDEDKIYPILHGGKMLYMCSKSWNQWLADMLDDTIPDSTYVLPDFCPKEESNDA